MNPELEFPAATGVRRCLAALSIFMSPGGFAAQPDAIEEVIVSAQLRPQAVQQIPVSISVISAQTMAERAANHFEQVLNLAPNVNFAAGASRGRFVQIRGIGERSQFVDPVNPSVGLFIDDIDFTGLGNAGTLFDAGQVEILRGPQGTAFGASAMAGLVNIRSVPATDDFEAALESSLAEYGGKTAGAMLSGPLSAQTRGRLAMYRARSDGFIDNDYLHRDNSNDIDETTVRARFDWQAGDDLATGLTLLHIDADNGYDAFSLDHNRHTLSDQPGHDRQQSDAAALRALWSAPQSFDVETVATVNATDLDYGYDEDWSYLGLCTGAPCEGWEYASTDRYIRDVDATSLDLRLVSKPGHELGGHAAWVAGIYTSRRDTTLDREYTFAAPFASGYDTDYLAGYGELDVALDPRWSMVAGMRVERFAADYDDSDSVVARPEETLWGGQLSVQYATDADAMAYLQVSRGYKPGGVNGEALGKAQAGGLDDSVIDFLRSRLEYETETLYNYELGYKSAANPRLQWRTALFYMDRKDVQLQSWYNTLINGAPIFVGYVDNAASGRNYGLEAEADWQAQDRLRINAGLGLLRTEIEDFSVLDPDNLVTPTLLDQSGRDQAHAPHWQYSLGAEWRLLEHLLLRLDVEGKDSFYFDDSNDQQSDAFHLLHAGLAWRGDHLDASLWVHNVTDEEYAVRGFYFGNDPRNFYANTPYYQFGEPRVAGFTVRYTL